MTALLPSPHALTAYRMISFLLFTFLLSVMWMMWYRGQKNYPPGPRRVPLLGSIPFMTMKNGILDFLLDSSVTRNRISTIAVGPFFKLHIINDYELAKVNLILLMYTSVFFTNYICTYSIFKDLFGREQFSGRPTSKFHEENRFYGKIPQGIINTEGQHWTAQRRFALKTLKDFGFGKQSLESAVNLEIDELIKCFLSHQEYLL